MSELLLGWAVDSEGAPRCWLDGRPTAPLPPECIVTIPANKMAAHTVVVAQSGAGKSFFLGRLVEELLLCTKAWCVIFDPNADFRLAHKVVDEELWLNAAYNAEKLRGLPHEAKREDFATRWDAVPKRIFTLDLPNDGDTAPYEPIRVAWPPLDPDLLSDSMDPVQQSQVRLCHRFVRAIADLVEIKRLARQDPDYELMTIAEGLVPSSHSILQWVLPKRQAKVEVIRETFPPSDLINFLLSPAGEELLRRTLFLTPTKTQDLDTSVRDAVIRKIRDAENAYRALSYVTDPIRKFYFGEGSYYKSLGLLTEQPPAETSDTNRLDVIDLPSVDGRRTRALVVSAILGQIQRQAQKSWKAALKDDPKKDSRRPMFLVLDEAHNLVPAKPQDSAQSTLTERFRTIAAEGRKYGLFLILVSQRPDKLDPQIVSECQNKALMKIDSDAVLSKVVPLLGLDELDETECRRCLSFGKGRVLIAGNWAGGGSSCKPLLAAARRTVEGGRNLREEHWATP